MLSVSLLPFIAMKGATLPPTLAAHFQSIAEALCLTKGIEVTKDACMRKTILELHEKENITSLPTSSAACRHTLLHSFRL